MERVVRAIERGVREIIPYHRPLPIKVDFTDIYESGMLTNDKYCRDLEEKIKKMYDVEYCLTTSNCTQGLLLSVYYLNPPYIQVPMFNWWSDLYVLQFLKQKIMWIDIDRESWLPEERYHGYSLYLHTFGNVGKSNRKDAIYDASHCLGSKLEGIGLATVISLAPTKLVTACEGGLILTNDQHFYEKAREWRDKTCRMSEPHAKIGLYLLKALKKVLQWKKKVYTYYKKNIRGQFQEIPNNSNYNTIGFLNLENLKIPNEIEYRQYYQLIHNDGIKKNANYVYNNMICLPSYYKCDYKKIVELIQDANK